MSTPYFWGFDRTVTSKYGCKDMAFDPTWAFYFRLELTYGSTKPMWWTKMCVELWTLIGSQALHLQRQQLQSVLIVCNTLRGHGFTSVNERRRSVTGCGLSTSVWTEQTELSTTACSSRHSTPYSNTTNIHTYSTLYASVRWPGGSYPVPRKHAFLSVRR